jgi:hypothetical protein
MLPKYLDISFESVGIRDSQKRLKGLIAEAAVQPVREFESELLNNFELVENIIRRRIALVIAYWCEHKHVPATPRPDDLMSNITNASKNDMTLREFYATEVKYAMHSLASSFGLNVRSSYEPALDVLVETLNQLGGRLLNGTETLGADDDALDDDMSAFAQVVPVAEKHPPLKTTVITQEAQFVEVEPVETYPKIEQKVDIKEVQIEAERAIIAAPPHQMIEVKDTALQDNSLKITVEEAWQLIYGLIGYQGDYIQGTLLPRWQQNPPAFDKDRRFLYGLFIDTLRNAAGMQHLSGNHTFKGRGITVDALWTHYFSDLAQNVAPQLAAAKLHNDANDPWYKKLWGSFQKEMGNLSPVWLIALAIALVLDALTTYISLDQTPMEGALVLLFTVLITALFQIADQLVISYRKREFEAEAMSAKFHAQYEGLAQEVSKLPITSESYVQLSMNKSKSHADWKAAEDNRRMARRGRFWSARIADINVVVTAYGFSFLFLNSREPMVAIVEQFEAIFVDNNLRNVDPWVFLMVGLAITVSFVVNTAQRTEILGWSMRRLKREA